MDIRVDPPANRLRLIIGLLASCLVGGATEASPLTWNNAAGTLLQLSLAGPSDTAPAIAQVRYQARLRYVSELLKEGRLPDSDPAHELTQHAKLSYPQAPQQAIEELDQALQQLDAIARANPTRQRLQGRYLTLLDGLQNFDAAFQRNAARATSDKSGRGYDTKAVADKLAEAEEFANRGQMMQAVRTLTTAENLVAQGLKGMLDHSRRGEGTVVNASKQEQADNAQTRAALEQQDYLSRKTALERFKEAHRRNVERLSQEEGKQAVVPYDAELVAWMEKQAQDYADHGNYVQAAQVLKGSVDMVAGPLQRMLDKHKYVVKLDISTPEKEYRYEQNRYLGYEELIPVAIKRLAPQPPLLDKVTALADKGRWMAAEAETKAAAQDYPVAIRMLQEATGQIQAALRLLGVPVLTGAEAMGGQ